jgi:hypothetical protein
VYSRLETLRETAVTQDMEHGLADLNLRQAVTQGSADMACELLLVAADGEDAVVSV